MQLLTKFCFVLFWPRIILFQAGGWGWWLEKVKIKLNSTQVVVEVRVELGKRCVSLSRIAGYNSLRYSS